MEKNPSSVNRSRYTNRVINAYKKELDGLGPTAKIEVVAELETFLREWRDGMAAAYFRRFWHYKEIQGKLARQYGVWEIYVLNNYRVIFMDREEIPDLVFLSVFRKTSTWREDTKRAVERAKHV